MYGEAMLEKLFYNLFSKSIDDILERRKQEKTEEKLEWEQRWRREFAETRQNVPIDLRVDWLEYRKAQLEQQFGNPKPEDALTAEELLYLAGEKHKEVHLQCEAEICCGNWVVELLPMLISGEEFRAKNWFYTKAGYQVIWILDFLEERDPDWDVTDLSGTHFRWYWKEPHEMLDGFFPQEQEDIRIYFQYTEPGADEDIMDRIIWVAEEKDAAGNRRTNYHTFVTAEDEVQDAASLKKLIGCDDCVDELNIIWDKND